MPQTSVLVTALILNHPLCPPCVAEKAALTPDQVNVALEHIRKVLSVIREDGRCRACGQTREVVSLSRPAI